MLLFAVGILGTAIAIYLRTANLYQTSGAIKLNIFDEDVIVYRDEVGVPYIFANSTADLIRAQGFVVAQDRVFQIELYRALINGQLAKLIGEPGLNSDIQMRVLDLRANAQRQYSSISDEHKAFLNWYADGYNAFLEQRKHEYPLELGLLGIEPNVIEAVDLLSVLNYAGFIHSKNYADELLTQNLIDELGIDEARQLFPLNINLDRDRVISPQTQTRLEQPRDATEATHNETLALRSPAFFDRLPVALPTSGSNNWVTGPAKSAGGKPILSNDPHLDARILPGPWYPIGLFSPKIQAVGANLPGVPGLLTGRTKYTAFGITNAYGDSQDLYIEDPTSTSFAQRTEIIMVKDSSQESGFREHRIVVRSSQRGPIVSDHAVFGGAGNQPLALRWALHEVKPEAIGIFDFLSAKTVEEFDAAVQKLPLMYLNFVFGDTNGGIGYRASGAVPIREHGSTIKVATSSDDWLGMIPANEMPGKLDPPKNWLGTSNHDVVPDDYPYYYSNHFSPYYRYQRTTEVMNSSEVLDQEDHWNLILDVKNKHAERLVPSFAKVLSDHQSTEQLANLLSSWNFEDDIDSSAATLFHLMHEVLIKRIFEDEMSSALFESFLPSRYYWLQRTDKIIIDGNSSFIDDKRTDKIEALDDLILDSAVAASEQLTAYFGSDSQTWKWGDFHTLRFISPLKQSGVGAAFLGQASAPASGSGETLNRGQYALNGGPYESQWFSSLRMVADLNDSEKVMAVVSGGNAARQFHPHFKSQLDAWRSEQWHPWWLDQQKVVENHRSKLVLKASD